MPETATAAVMTEAAKDLEAISNTTYPFKNRVIHRYNLDETIEGLAMAATGHGIRVAVFSWA